MKLKNALLATALLAVSGTAGAAEFYTYVPGLGTLDHDSFESGQDAKVNVKFNSIVFDGNGGLFQGYFSDVNIGDQNPPDSFFRYFCIELGQSTNGAQTQYLSSIPTLDNVAKLFDLAFPRNGAGDFWDGGKTNFGLFGSGAAAAAFQVALWNLYLDGDFSLTAGPFTWNGDANVDAIALAAQNLLTQVQNYVGTGYQNWTLYQFVHPTADTSRECTEQNPCYQNYLSATVRSVPEPASLALFGLALAGLGMVSRRRRQ